MTQDRFIFELHPIGDGPPIECRVRKFLKALGRIYGLRVTWPEPSPSADRRSAGRESAPAGIVEGEDDQ